MESINPTIEAAIKFSSVYTQGGMVRKQLGVVPRKVKNVEAEGCEKGI